MRYVFTNPEEIPILTPGVEYTTKIIGIAYESNGFPVLTLKYVGEVHDQNNPTCLFPISENVDYYIHPFVD